MGTVRGRHGSTVVSAVASQLQRPGFDSRLGSLSVWSLHILLVSKDVRVRLIGHIKIAPECPGMHRLEGLSGKYVGTRG